MRNTSTKTQPSTETYIRTLYQDDLGELLISVAYYVTYLKCNLVILNQGATDIQLADT